MYNIVIVGAGGFGREVYLWAKETFSKDEYKIKGFVSNKPHDLDNFDIEEKILGDENSYQIEENDRFLYAIGDIPAKKRMTNNLKKRGAKFLTLIHPKAIVAYSAKIGEGVIICPFVTITDSVEIDDFAMLNFYASCGHDAKIGKYCILSPYATLNGFAELEDEVFMGTHSTVVAHKKIGFNSKISANTVAMKNVKPNSFVFGESGKSKTIFFPKG